MVKNPTAIQETWVQFLGWEDPLEKGIATRSSILPWRIPWTEEPGGYSPQGHKESDTTEQLPLEDIRLKYQDLDHLHSWGMTHFFCCCLFLSKL